MHNSFKSDFEAANRYFRAGHFQKAIVFYQYALQQNQTNAAVYENLGDALYQSEQYHKSEAAYQSALSLSPGSPYAHAQLGRIFAQQQRYPEAIASHRQAIALAPTCIPYSYDLAQVLLTQGKPAEAAKIYKRLGAVLRQDELIEEAIAAYQKAITLQPTLPDLHQAVGECYHRHGDFPAAVSHYEKVAQLSKSPQHLWFYKNWGEALLIAGSA